MIGHRAAVRVSLALAASCVLGACGSDAPSGPDGEGDDDPPPQGILRGVGLSPQGFPDDFTQVAAFFDEVTSMNRGAVMWNGAWRDDLVLGRDAGSVPAAAQLVADFSGDGANYAPVAVFGWRGEGQRYIAVPGDPTNAWSNETARAAYVQVVRAYADARKPPLLFLGNESDFAWEEDPDDYLDWLAVYDDAVDAIRAVSPGTLVGPVFNVEHLMGWGEFSGWTTPTTPAFTLHDRTRIDVVGLTVYPYLGIAQAGDVPADYLDPVFALLGDLPVAVTETGWPAATPAGTATPWTASPTAQTVWLERLSDGLDGRDVRLVNWLFLHPPQSGATSVLTTFGSVSLRDATGGKRPVYDAFVAFGAPSN